jgi:hypothetical protein
MEENAVAKLQLHGLTKLKPSIVNQLNISSFTYNNASRERQIHTLDVQKKAAKFARHTNESNLETLSQHRKISCICALFKAYSGERAWKATGDWLQQSNYLSRVDHERKIRNRRQRTDIRKYSFVNRAIQLWNQLPAEILGYLPCKPNAFKKRVRKVINVVNWRKCVKTI